MTCQPYRDSFLAGLKPDPQLTRRHPEARVFCFLLDREFSCIEGNGRWVRFTDGHKTFNASVSYTRSRDAIKAIRPEGWFSGAEPNFEDQGMYCGLDSDLVTKAQIILHKFS